MSPKMTAAGVGALTLKMNAAKAVEMSFTNCLSQDYSNLDDLPSPTCILALKGVFGERFKYVNIHAIANDVKEA